MKTLFALSLSCAVASFSSAQTWTVDDDFNDYPDADFSSIQDALDVSVHGDTILVYPGTYTRNTGSMVLNIPSHQLEIITTCGPEETIIDAENTKIGVYFNSGTQATTLFDGFTVRNGVNFNGGGILIFGGPTINNCIITDNLAGSVGGGISTFGNPTITNCLVKDNNSMGAGGGVHVQANLAPSFENCTIRNNIGNQNGGGVYLQSSKATFTNCMISENSSSATGGGVFIFGNNNPNPASTIFDSCFIVDNFAAQHIGSGVHGDVAILPTLLNTLVCNNNPTESQLEGWIDGGGNTISVNCPLGACCKPDDSCEYTEPSGCASFNGQWLGIETSCQDCEQITMGSCCYDFSCEETDEKTCYFLEGTWISGNTCECAPCNLNPDLGACCFEGAAGPYCKDNIEESWCSEMNGVWYQDTWCKEIKCEPKPTPTGACCYLADSGLMSCLVVTEKDCETILDSTYHGNNTTCIDTECFQPIGACCICDSCVLTTEQNCESAGGIFSGDGISCQGITCIFCREDLDGNGTVDVNDLLMLIAAWGACP